MRYLLCLALAGCFPPPQYLAADVTVHRMPVAGALVAADCVDGTAAGLTDERGYVQLALHGNIDAARCRITIAAPTLPTFASTGASLCTAPHACPTMAVDLGGVR
jgi:hypothetical protein